MKDNDFATARAPAAAGAAPPDASARSLARYKDVMMPTYGPSLVLSHGKGARVWDEEGASYLDFCCGISVCNLGHCHPRVVEAVSRQAARLMHVSNLYANGPQIELAERLSALAGGARVFFCNSGAEANEGMVKFARRWGRPGGRWKILSMRDSFHGRTLATLAATGREKYRDGFQPDTPGFQHIPFNDIAAAREAVDGQTAAILLEPVQGEGGVTPAAPGYLKDLRALCDERGVLLMLDEVQSGMGRTGTMFAHEQDGVAPDLMSLAKGLGGGLPLGAFLARRELGEVLTQGTHASTFGGNPVSCAAAIATLDVIESEGLLAHCRAMREVFDGLAASLMRAHPGLLAGVRGRGLMLGLLLSGVSPAALVKAAQAKGLLLLPAGEDVVRFYPPINVTREELAEGVERLSEAFALAAAAEGRAA